jgi:hypothetical protein
MPDCDKDWSWKPSSDDDAKNWRKHLDCRGSHLAWIVLYSGTDSHTVLEIFKSGALGKTYRNWGLNFWEIPNLDEDCVDWLDKESLNWPLAQSFYYWVERHSRFDLNKSPIEENSALRSSFGSKILTQDLQDEECYQETFRISKQFAQHLWYDLWKQGDMDFTYQEDSVDGDTFRPYDTPTPESYVDLLSDGFFTSWISHENAIDVSYGVDYVAGRIEDEGLRYCCDEIDDDSLCRALVAGQQSNDLEITGDLEAYFERSGLFGETDREYPVTVESPPDWIGKRYEQLTSEEQLHLAKNLISSMSHPLLSPKHGVVAHLLFCIGLHENTSEPVKEVLAKAASTAI